MNEQIKEGPYPSFRLANNILWLGKEHNRSISNLQLQKFLYFAHGYYIAKTDKPLCEEPFQPWRYGPVLGSVYHCCKEYGSGPVKSYCAEFDPISKDFISFRVNIFKDTVLQDVLSEVWDIYSDKDALDLVELSHKEGGAWHEAREKNLLYIDNESIKKEFQKGVSHG